VVRLTEPAGPGPGAGNEGAEEVPDLGDLFGAQLLQP
jgi:hypothetical protein